MPKTILASLTGYGADRAVMDTAVAAARIDGAHITCLHVGVGPREAAALVEATTSDYLIDQDAASRRLADEQNERLGRAKLAYDEACQRHNLLETDKPCDGAVSASWRQVHSLLNETLEEARYHDLVVMAREEVLSAERIESVLMRSGRPLLLAARKALPQLGRKVAIAWKVGPECARAMTAAMPILIHADEVIVLTVSNDEVCDETDRGSAEKLASTLRWHGVTARVGVQHAAKDESRVLKEMVYGCDADLLVMGAYGHSRLREIVLGGTTRDFLADCAIPVFMVG